MNLIKRFGVAVGVFLVLLVLILVGVYVFFSEPSVQEVGSPSRSPDPSLGLENIDVSQLDSLPIGGNFSDDSVDDNFVPGDSRDDRLYTPPLSAERGGDGVVETKENIPRLVRLFKGPTAGYRIDKEDDGLWSVKIVGQGRGHRYLVETVPYSLKLISRGEFTRVVEAHLFADEQVLVQHESTDNEFTVRSSFVPFSTTDTGSRVQWFEDDIRVATNNENLLFFTHIVDDKSVGVVVDVSSPKDTRVVWESGFKTWLPRWGRNSRITLRTPTTEYMKGLVYLIDPDGVAPNDQFATLSSGGSAFMDSTTDYFVLFETGERSFAGKTSIVNRPRTVSINMPVTLPEKCDGFNGVFVCAVPREIPTRTLTGHDTVFPDSWYQGDIQLDDVIVLVNALTGEKQMLMDPEESEIRTLSDDSIFDVIHPRVSEDGEFLFFVNKYDMSLWMLRLF